MNTLFRRSVLCAAVGAALVLSGCATHSDKLGFADNEGTKTYAEAYEPARQMMFQGQWDAMRAKLNENTSREVKEETKTAEGEIRQTVRTEKLTNEEEMERMIKEQSELAIVERGLLTLNVGDFERALFYFDAAEEKLGLTEADDTVSGAASKYGKTGLSVLLGSEEMANYELRGYEKVMLLNYKALCYMLMGDRKAYNVTRRAIDLQQAEWEKFQAVLAELEKKKEERKQIVKDSIENIDKEIVKLQEEIKQTEREMAEYRNSPNFRDDALSRSLIKSWQKSIDSDRKWIQSQQNSRAEYVAELSGDDQSMSASDVDDRTDEVKAKAASVSSAYVNPFGDYLNAMMMEIDGFDDPTMRQNAKIAYKKVVDNNKDCAAARQAVRNVEKGLKEDRKLVQILLSDGFSPYQVEKTKVFPIPIDDRVINAVVNYSNATPVPTQTAGARVMVGGKSMNLSSLTKMESLILRDEADRLPLRATMFGLAILRSTATGAFLGNLGSALAGKIQHPDTRSWLTLPNQVYVARIAVPKSQSNLKLETVGEDGSVLASQNVKLAKDGPTVVYAVSYDKNMQVYANAFSWVD